MFVVVEILPDGHEDLDAGVIAYMQSMAERHGFTILDPETVSAGIPVRIEINYSRLSDRVFQAILEER